jgi:hypothetical protein
MNLKNGLSKIWGKTSLEMFLKEEPMPFEEMTELLEKPHISSLEALHLSCDRRITAPHCFFLTKEMVDLHNAIISAQQESLICVTPPSSDHEHELNWFEGCFVKIKSLWSPYSTMLTASYLEWAINRCVPLPDKLMNHLKIAPLTRYSFDQVKAKRNDHVAFSFSDLSILYTNFSIPKLSIPEIRSIQLRVTAQVFLFLYHNISPTEIEKNIEKDPVMKQWLPGGRKYQDKETFKSKIRDLISKFTPCGEIVRIADNSYTYLDLRKLKLTCETIATVLRRLQPQISADEIKEHPLVQLYLKEGHPLIRQLYETWGLPSQEAAK